MNLEEIRRYCLTFPAVEESFPFDEETLVFKVEGKMFALLPLEKGNLINLKCNPEKAAQLREHYDAVMPGYHMNKKHWNTVDFGKLPDKMVQKMIDDSYHLVVATLPLKTRKKFQK